MSNATKAQIDFGVRRSAFGVHVSPLLPAGFVPGAPLEAAGAQERRKHSIAAPGHETVVHSPRGCMEPSRTDVVDGACFTAAAAVGAECDE